MGGGGEGGGFELGFDLSEISQPVCVIMLKVVPKPPNLFILFTHVNNTNKQILKPLLKTV